MTNEIKTTSLKPLSLGDELTWKYEYSGMSHKINLHSISLSRGEKYVQRIVSKNHFLDKLSVATCNLIVMCPYLKNTQRNKIFWTKSHPTRYKPASKLCRCENCINFIKDLGMGYHCSLLTLQCDYTCKLCRPYFCLNNPLFLDLDLDI